MEKSVLKAISQFSLLPEGTKSVTVALSGGADSMALLRVLLELKEQLGITVNAAHLNHMIRGAEAERDEMFVKEQCQRFKVTLFTERADVPKFAVENKLSIELAARKIRYDFLTRVGGDLIATAHNAGDNLETMLFNLTRGTGIEGLCGIPPKRDNFIRPLILCTRDQIEDYCEKNKVPFITDSTNLSDDYTRNKIRHRITPILREINPSVEKAALRTAETLRQDNQVISLAAIGYISENSVSGELKLENFNTLPEAIAKRVLKGFIEENYRLSLEAVHIASVYEAVLKRGRVGLPKKMMADAKSGSLKIYSYDEKSIKSNSFSTKITERAYTFTENNKKINNLLLNSLLDCDKIIGKLVLRTKCAGDSIRLYGRGCTKTLSKLFCENAVPVRERDNIPVIADDKGVVWVYGLGVAQRCAVGVNTKRVFEITTQVE